MAKDSKCILKENGITREFDNYLVFAIDPEAQVIGIHFMASLSKDDSIKLGNEAIKFGSRIIDYFLPTTKTIMDSENTRLK